MTTLINLKGRIALVVVACIGLGWPDLHAQGMIIETRGGTRSTEMLNSIEILKFTDQFLIVNNNSSTIHSYDIQAIRKIFFDPAASRREKAPVSGKILIYPNPAFDHICINAPAADGTTIQIFSVQGVKILESTITSSDPEIDISQLSPGMYVIRINEQAARFVKQ